MNWIPVAPSEPTRGIPPPVLDTRVSSQQIDIALAGNLNIGSIFNGSISGNEVGYWLDAMAYSDQYEQAPGPNSLVVANRFGYGLRVLFRVRQIKPKASFNYGLIGASLDAGFVQASYEIDGLGFGPLANQALAAILDGIAASGPALTGDTFYKLNSSILKNLSSYILANQATMQPVRVATMVVSTQSDNSLAASHAILFAMRSIRAGDSLDEALGSAGDLDSTAIRLAYASILGAAPAATKPSDANKYSADKWLADEYQH